MAESKEVKEARALAATLSANGYMKPKAPDFTPLDIAELGKEIPGLVDGFAADEATTRTCEHCGGEIKRLELPDPFGRPGHKFRPWPACPCVIKAHEKQQAWEARMERKRRLQQTYAKNIVSPAIVNARFDNFMPRPGTETTYKKALEFAKSFDENTTTGLLLFGPTGNGKSHLGRSIERELDAQGWATLFLDWPQLVELAKATFNKQSKVTTADYIRAALDADLLVLDEIGAGALTSFEFKELLFPIINGRSGKATVFTTNLDPDRLERWFAEDKDGRPLDTDGRLIDRILGGCSIVINRGTSKRREDAKRRIEG